MSDANEAVEQIEAVELTTVDEHVHDWRFDTAHSSSLMLRYTCECGVMGWTTTDAVKVARRFGSRPKIREYTARGRAEVEKRFVRLSRRAEELETAERCASGGRKPTLDECDAEEET